MKKVIFILLVVFAIVFIIPQVSQAQSNPFAPPELNPLPYNPFYVILPFVLIGTTVPFGITTLGFSYINYGYQIPSYIASIRLPVGVISSLSGTLFALTK